MTTFTTVRLGDEEIRIERASGRKANRALALMRAVSGAVPDIVKQWGEFVTEFERTNVVELDRVQARLRFPRQPIYDANDEPLRDEQGEVILAPSRIDAMSETDWEQAGGKVRLPRSPSVPQQIAAVLPHALELAEDHVYRLVALFTLSNADVKRYARDGSLNDVLAERADALLDDAMVDELLELAVAIGEVIDGQLRGKLDELGDRVGNALRLLGLGPTEGQPQEPTSTDGRESSTPGSSTDSPAPTDGPPTPPSTSPTTSSENSAESSEPSRTPPTSPPTATSESQPETVSTA